MQSSKLSIDLFLVLLNLEIFFANAEFSKFLIAKSVKIQNMLIAKIRNVFVNCKKKVKLS